MTSPSNSIHGMSRARPWRIACVVLTVAAATTTGADGTWDRPGDGV